jgi:hypothetical protein
MATLTPSQRRANLRLAWTLAAVALVIGLAFVGKIVWLHA